MAAKNRLTSKTVALPACGERVRVRGTLKKLDSQRLPLTRRFAPTSPRKRGEVR
jgi:hypothetical protein